MMDASDQQDAFVVAASFSLPHEAQFAKWLLESYGIEVLLADENTAGMGVHLSHIIGGAKVVVRRTDCRTRSNCSDPRTRAKPRLLTKTRTRKRDLSAGTR